MMTVAADHETIAHRVATLLGEIAAAPSVLRAQQGADELARTLVELYGEALERILTIVDDTAGERSDAIFAALCGDRFVESLLVLHELHPLSREDRVRAALDEVRPYLESHAGGIEVVAVADGVAHLRLEGTCDGCPSSSATVKLAVERAILDRVHDVTEVRVENVTPAREASPAPTLRLEGDWIALDTLTALNANGLAHLNVADTPVLLITQGNNLLAFRDRCPTCARTFEAAMYTHPIVTCACGAGYDVARGGRAQRDGSMCAEPFPLVRDGARVRIAIPLGV